MDKERMKSFSQQVFRDMAGGMTAGLAYLGTTTGLFRAMAGQGPMTATQVTAASGLQPRYVEEWLKGMAAGGYLDYHPELGTFALPDEHAYFLASDDTDHFMGGLFYALPGFVGQAPQVARAFREGGGVPFDAFGEEAVTSIDLSNRGAYEHRFASQWLPAVPDAVAALEAGGQALDFGCGVGRVSLALARAFPKARFMGLDLHEGSIRRAQAAAAEAGLAQRVEFRAQPIEALEPALRFDLITACDCIHDLPDPVPVLREVRARLAPQGVLFLVELKAGDRLEENLHPIGAMFYGFSLFHCLTQAMARGGTGLGNSLGPARVGALMREAGFGRCELLEIRSSINHFYAVRP